MRENGEFRFHTGLPQSSVNPREWLWSSEVRSQFQLPENLMGPTTETAKIFASLQPTRTTDVPQLVDAAQLFVDTLVSAVYQNEHTAKRAIRWCVAEAFTRNPHISDTDQRLAVAALYPDYLPVSAELTQAFASDEPGKLISTLQFLARIHDFPSVRTHVEQALGWSLTTPNGYFAYEHSDPSKPLRAIVRYVKTVGEDGKTAASYAVFSPSEEDGNSPLPVCQVTASEIYPIALPMEAGTELRRWFIRVPEIYKFFDDQYDKEQLGVFYSVSLKGNSLLLWRLDCTSADGPKMVLVGKMALPDGLGGNPDASLLDLEFDYPTGTHFFNWKAAQQEGKDPCSCVTDRRGQTVVLPPEMHDADVSVWESDEQHAFIIARLKDKSYIYVLSYGELAYDRNDDQQRRIRCIEGSIPLCLDETSKTLITTRKSNTGEVTLSAIDRFGNERAICTKTDIRTMLSQAGIRHDVCIDLTNELGRSPFAIINGVCIPFTYIWKRQEFTGWIVLPTQFSETRYDSNIFRLVGHTAYIAVGYDAAHIASMRRYGSNKPINGGLGELNAEPNGDFHFLKHTIEIQLPQPEGSVG